MKRLHALLCALAVINASAQVTIQVDARLTPVDSIQPYRVQAKTQATPKESRIGFATRNSKASFTHPIPLPKSGKPEFVSGDWILAPEGHVSQTSTKEQCVALCKAKVGDHYTVKFRARKDGGDEGFMVVFNYTDDSNYCWINLGGWGNTQHGIERISGGGRSLIETKPGKIETGRWYDVTLQMAGDTLKCWLDQDLVFDTVL